MTALIVGLIGLVVGSILQTATGWINDARSAKREHAHWLREKRFAAYVDLPRTMRHLLDAMKEGNPHAVRTGLTDFNDARFLATMLADQQTVGVIQAETLKYVVTWKGDPPEAEAAISRLQYALAPYVTQHKPVKDAGRDPRLSVADILAWDAKQKEKFPDDEPDIP